MAATMFCIDAEKTEALADQVESRGSYSVDRDFCRLVLCSNCPGDSGPSAVVSVLATGSVLQICEDAVTLFDSVAEYLDDIYPPAE